MSACREHDYQSRSPRGERGLKYLRVDTLSISKGRSPRGERGLKSFALSPSVGREMSLPARGAWIEISMRDSICGLAVVAPREGSVD